MEAATRETHKLEAHDEKGKHKLGLTSKIFIALIAGAIVGVVCNYLVEPDSTVDAMLIEGLFYIVGQGFIRLMQMLVVPLVFFSIVCGAASIGSGKMLGKVGGTTLVFYLCTTAIAIAIALCVGNLINPGIGLDMGSIVKSDTAPVTNNQTMTETLLNIIPSNVFGSLSSGTMLQIIFFALILGIILGRLGKRVTLVSKLFNQCNDIMMAMTVLIMKVAPIGVFCMIARTFANLGFEGFLPMLKYMGGVFLALGLQCLVVYMILLVVFARVNPFRFLKKFLPVFGFAFSTSTSNATIPLNIETLQYKMGVDPKIASFTIPLGATINMDGTAIMQGVAVVFVAQAYGIPLDFTAYLTVIAAATMASIGTAGVPSVGLITLSMVFESVGLPVEGIALIMGIDRILDMTRTAVNVTGDAVITTIVAKQNGYFDKEVFKAHTADEEARIDELIADEGDAEEAEAEKEDAYA